MAQIKVKKIFLTAALRIIISSIGLTQITMELSSGHLGDSFLRIYQSDEPGSAGFIAHLAAELGFDLASIVSDGGASTLVRQQLYRKPALLANKKIVIWEFVERDIRFGTEGWQDIPLPVFEPAAAKNS